MVVSRFKLVFILGQQCKIADTVVIRLGKRVMDRAGEQQLAVTAHFSDGSTRDVTRDAQFESNDPELAEVSTPVNAMHRTCCHTG